MYVWLRLNVIIWSVLIHLYYASKMYPQEKWNFTEQYSRYNVKCYHEQIYDCYFDFSMGLHVK